MDLSIRQLTPDEQRAREYRRQLAYEERTYHFYRASGTAKEDPNRLHAMYAALFLAAVRMAELRLHQCEQGTAMWPRARAADATPYWRDLLNRRMRERLRRAEVNPYDIEPDGLGQFMPAGTAARAGSTGQGREVHTKSRLPSWHAPETPQFMQRKTREVEDGGA